MAVHLRRLGRPLPTRNQAETFCQHSRRHEDDQHAEAQESSTPWIEVRGDTVPRHPNCATHADFKSESQRQPQQSNRPPAPRGLGAKPPQREPEDEDDQHSPGEHADLSRQEIAEWWLK